MDPSEVPVYYKGDDGIYRPMVDIRQVPSTSSGIYKTMLWNGNSAIFQQSHSSSSVSSNMPKQQKKSSDLEASLSPTREVEYTGDIRDLPSTSSGIYRPMGRISPKQQSHISSLEPCLGENNKPENIVGIQQLPSTSSAINKSIDWLTPTNQSQESNLEGNRGVIGHLQKRIDHEKNPSTNSGLHIPPTVPNHQTTTNNLEVCQGGKAQIDKVDIQQPPIASSGMGRQMFTSSQNHETVSSNLEACQDDKDQPKSTVQIQGIPSTSSEIYSPLPRITPKHQTNGSNLEVDEKVQEDYAVDIYQNLSTSSGIYLPVAMIKPKQQTKANNLRVCRGKKEQADIQQLPQRNSGKCRPLTRIMPKQQTKTINMDILKGEKEQVGNLANNKHLSSGNSVIYTPPIVLNMKKSLSLPEFLPPSKLQTKVKNLPSFQSEIDLTGNDCSTSSGMIVSNNQKLGKNSSTSSQVQELIRNTTLIQSLPTRTSTPIACNKQKQKEAAVEIPKGKQEQIRNIIELLNSKNNGTKVLNKFKQTKKTSNLNAGRGKKKSGNIIPDIEQLPTTYGINRPTKPKNPKQQTKLNNVDSSRKENEVVKNMIDIQQQTSSSSEIYRPLIWDMKKSFSLLESLLPNKEQVIANNFASCNGEKVQAKNVAVNRQPSTTSGVNSTVAKNITKTIIRSIPLLPKKQQTIKTSDVEDLHSKNSGIYRPVLWNLPDLLVLPDLSLLKKGEELADEKSCIGEMEDTEHRRDNEPDCSEKDLLFGLQYGKIKTLYLHIMGTSTQPNTLREIGLLTVKTMLCSIEQKLLIKLVEKDKFVNFNRMVLWGFNRTRPLGFLFSTVKPVNYSFDEAKTHLLKYVKGFYFKNNKDKKIDKSDHIECQACRKRMSNISRFVDHLNRATSEITYMCRHCGYLRFTNMCALVYHILADNYMKPSLEYCLVCGLYCESLAHHLMDRDNFVHNKKVQCLSCEFAAFSICSLKFHLAYHTEELPYICPECGEYFSFKEHLEEHMKNVCLMNYKFKYYFCTSESCGMIFSYLENFYSHISTEHYERRVICTICHKMFSAQREFLAHRTNEHPGEVCSYNVYNHCTLCPNSTFRAMSQQKHLTSHGCENKCSTIVYKCQCDFQTRFKIKFIEHKKTAACHHKTFHRPQIMKICQNCFDIQSFNYMVPVFICEECQQILQPSLSLMNYYCELCHLVIDYSWSSVLDHFFVFHKRVDLLSLSLHTMLIVSKNKVVPGRYLSQKSVIEVDVEFMNKYVKELPGSRNTPALRTESKKLDSSVGDLTQEVGRIRVRSPGSINASLSSINQGVSPLNMCEDASISNTFQDNSAINCKNMKQTNSKTLEQTKLNTLSLDNISVPTIKGSKIARQDIFFCRKCNFTSCAQSEMSRHCQRHNPTEYKCSECDHIFKTSFARNNHLSKDHGLCLLAENQDHVELVKHGEIQKILKQQIQGKLSSKQAGKRRSAEYKHAEDKEVYGGPNIVLEIDISED